MRVLITTVPFGEQNRTPINLLNQNNVDYFLNPYNRKFSENELLELIKDFDIVIAGTDKFSKKILNEAKKLKFISRVGIGLDSLDLLEIKSKGIKVSFTPDAPSPAIAELTIGMMLTLLRSTHLSNIKMHKGDWYRTMGRSISQITVGLIGVGRVGLKIINYLNNFGPPKILANDISNDVKKMNLPVNWVDKEIILKESDLVTLHLPLTNATKNLIKQEQLFSMKKDAIIINTSRGGIINENDLYYVMKSGHLSGAAIDVFEEEPYKGSLKEIERCLLTSHIGSMSKDCRARMEIEATEEVLRFIKGENLLSLVPKEEYLAQEDGLK